MEIRPLVGPEELQVCTDIFFASMNELHERQGQSPYIPEESGWLPNSLEHLFATDPHLLVVALESGEPVAFGSALRRGDWWFLAYLFVLPSVQGRGIGRAVLEYLLPEPQAGLTLGTAVESTQPASTMLYATYGISPRVPWHHMDGPIEPELLHPLDAGVVGTEMSAESPERLRADLDALDARLLGYARPEDHRWFLDGAQAARVYREGGQILGYGYLDSEDFLAGVLGVDQLTTIGIVRDILAQAGPKVTVPIVGSSGDILQALLGAGARCSMERAILYSSNGRTPPPSYIPYAPFLP